MQTFEFDGKKYEKASAHQKEWGTRLISSLNLIGSEHVLDLGCGDGVLTSRIAELVPAGSVLGIDGSRGMIDAARSRERKNLHFSVMDINDLDFENRFDAVFSNATFHWIKDHPRLLRNIHRALRPSGRIRFQFGGAGNCEYFISVIREALQQDEFSSTFADFEWPWYMPDVKEYRNLVRSSGFKDIRVWGQNADRYFSNTGELIGWIDQPSIVPFLAHIEDKPEKDRFRDFVVSGMIKKTKQKDGRCFETFRRINVSAVK